MVDQNRRKNGKGIPLSDNEQAKKEAELLHALLMLRMKPLGKKATMYLVPDGYDILKNRRVRFLKRENGITGAEERFLPKAKLEQVIVFKSALYKGKKYYLVFSDSAKSHTRIVWGVYCAPLGSKEFMDPFNFQKKK